MSSVEILIILCTIFVSVLIMTLDFKLWSKLDRMSALILGEREVILKKIESLLTRIEEIEIRLKKKS